MTTRIAVVTTGWLVAAAAACGPAHVQSYTPKQRVIEAPAEDKGAADAKAPGSLWQKGQVGGGLFVDARAFRKNDIVVVKVEEVADAERSADTDVARSSKMQLGVKAVPIIGPLIPAGNDVDATGEASTETSFAGGGTTNRRERLVATVSTVVKQVMPNGNLFIEGHRVILVNAEEHHLYVSGVVRPIDIDEDNSVASSKIAEAEIEFVGRGVVSDNNEQGVAQRFLHWIWPF